MCAYHGIEFACDGTCLHIPQQGTIVPAMRVRSYPLVERWGLAWIWMGDANRADPGAIPDYGWLSSADWHSLVPALSREGQNYEICADNILDLSHTPYVHTQTIRRYAADGDDSLKTWTEGDVVYSRRVMQQVTPGPFVYRWGTSPAQSIGSPPPSGSAGRATSASAGLRSAVSAQMHACVSPDPLTPETDRNHPSCSSPWSRDFGNADDEAFTRRRASR